MMLHSLFILIFNLTPKRSLKFLIQSVLSLMENLPPLLQDYATGFKLLLLFIVLAISILPQFVYAIRKRQKNQFYFIKHSPQTTGHVTAF